MNQIYTLNINRRIYWSMSTAEIAAFALSFGMTGEPEIGAIVPWTFEGVICIEQY